VAATNTPAHTQYEAIIRAGVSGSTEHNALVVRQQLEGIPSIVGVLSATGCAFKKSKHTFRLVAVKQEFICCLHLMPQWPQCKLCSDCNTSAQQGPVFCLFKESSL
jgi:hypothetical protein